MSFRLKTMLGFAAIQGLLFLLYVVIVGDFMHKFEGEESEKQAKTIATLFATEIKNVVISKNLDLLQSHTEKAIKYHKLVYARVLNHDGIVIAQSGDFKTLKPPLKTDTRTRNRRNVKSAKNIFEPYANIYKDGNVYGKVQIGLRSTNVQVLPEKAKTIAFILIFVGILFSFLFGSWLTRNVKALEIGVSRIRAGQFGYQIKVYGNDELAMTADTFNAMSLEVEQLYNQLSDTNKELEDNVSKLSKSHEQLHQNETHLADVINTMKDGLLVIDEKGLIIDFNPAAESIFGYELKDVLGRNINMLMPQPNQGQHDKYLKHYRETGQKKIIDTGREVNGMRKDGSMFPLELTVSEAGGIDTQKTFTGIVRDISKRKQVQSTLALRQQQVEIIRNAQAGFIAGVDSTNFFQGILPDILELTNSEFGFIGELIQESDQEPYHKIYALTDITWGKDVQELYTQNALRDLRFNSFDNLFSRVFDTGKPVFGHDLKQNVDNDNILLGYDHIHNFLGLPIYLGQRLMGTIGLANRSDGYNEEIIERLRPILSTCAQLFNALAKERERQKNVQQLQQEVIARKKAQAKLSDFNATLEQRASERANELQRLYLISAILSVTETSLDDIFNSIVTVLSSLSETEDICVKISYDGKHYPSNNFQDRPCKGTAPIVINDVPRGTIEIGTLKQTPYDDMEIFEYQSLLDAVSYDINSAIEHRNSIDDQKSMEVQLRQAQKLEAVGQLAAGIAHEINTPTQFVTDNTHFIEEAFADIERLLDAYNKLAEEIPTAGSISEELLNKVKQLAEEIDVEYLKKEIPQAVNQSLEGLERIARIVQAMKEFSHPGTEEKTPTDLNRAIETTLDVSRNEWKYHADLIKTFDPELPPVPVLPGEFNQVILNLVVNAAHAIPESNDGKTDKGEIVIATRRCGEWVDIIVKDNGDGIPDNIKNRIFDPFFTTKEVGKGSGQGLAIAWSVIVDKHGGTLDVDSEEGVGTTFTIHLPIMENAA